MTALREFALREERLACGHRLCPGCPEPMMARLVMKATKDPIVVASATGCLQVSCAIFPQTAWKVPWIHNAFENTAATLTGVETAYKALKKQGKITKDIKFVAFGGDGGTYDIGLQALSGAMERGHDFLYVCLDNEGYMNTGIQRSSSTPLGAWTNTSQVGSVHKGKEETRKDIMGIVAAHNIKYLAQSSPSHYNDLLRKAETAFQTPGPTFINTLSPCMLGWKFDAHLSITLAKLAVDTCFWPLYEIVDGKWILNYDPGDKKKPIIEWIRPQGRFKHLLLPENAHILEMLQKDVDEHWEALKKRCAGNS